MMKKDMNDALYPSVGNVICKNCGVRDEDGFISEFYCSKCEKEDMEEKRVAEYTKKAKKIKTYEKQIVIRASCHQYDEAHNLDFLIQEAIGDNQDNLVSYFLYDDKIRGDDDIEWNDYGYENRCDINFHEEYDEDYACSDEEETYKNNKRDLALNCFSWYSVKDYFGDSFDNNGDKIPTYKFKNQTWILNVNDFMNLHGIY